MAGGKSREGMMTFDVLLRPHMDGIEPEVVGTIEVPYTLSIEGVLSMDLDKALTGREKKPQPNVIRDSAGNVVLNLGSN